MAAGTASLDCLPTATGALHMEERSLGQQIHYQDPQGHSMIGYLCLPDATGGAVAGVAVVPEAPGLGPMPRKRAEMLAAMGYAALAIDLYGEGLFTGYIEEAQIRAQAMLADPALLLARAKAGIDALAAQPAVDADRIAAIGYCLGGKAVLDLARAGTPLKGVVAYHGLLVPLAVASAGAITARLLVLSGAEDALVPISDVAAFCAEMTAARADYRLMVYGGAGHAFTSFDVPRDTMPPETGNFGFDQAADRSAWNETAEFLSEIL